MSAPITILGRFKIFRPDGRVLHGSTLRTVDWKEAFVVHDYARMRWRGLVAYYPRLVCVSLDRAGELLDRVVVEGAP